MFGLILLNIEGKEIELNRVGGLSRQIDYISE